MATVFDDFNRANSATLGTSSSGAVWTEQLTASYDTFSGATIVPVTSSLGIINDGVDGRAYRSGGSGTRLHIATIDSGSPDGTYRIRNAVSIGPGDGAGLIFRYSDSDHFWFVACITDTSPFGFEQIAVYCFKQNGTGIANRTTPLGGGIYLGLYGGGTPDLVTAVLDGDSIEVYTNDTLRFSGTDSFNNTATKHGIGNYSGSTPRLDDAYGLTSFSVPPLQIGQRDDSVWTPTLRINSSAGQDTNRIGWENTYF